MRERLLGASGADLSRVYFMHECGSLHDVWFGSVFHWDDLTADQADDVDRDQARRSRAHAPAVAVPFADLLAAWQLVQHLGELIGEPVQRVAMCCPSCGGDDVTEDGSEDCEPGTVERWCMCHGCGATWTDTYVVAARTVLTSGGPVVAVDSWPEPGPADHLEMAHEDANGCGVEL